MLVSFVNEGPVGRVGEIAKNLFRVHPCKIQDQRCALDMDN